MDLEVRHRSSRQDRRDEFVATLPASGVRTSAGFSSDFRTSPRYHGNRLLTRLYFYAYDNFFFFFFLSSIRCCHFFWSFLPPWGMGSILFVLEGHGVRSVFNCSSFFFAGQVSFCSFYEALLGTASTHRAAHWKGELQNTYLVRHLIRLRRCSPATPC